MKLLKVFVFFFLLLVLTGCDLFSSKVTTTLPSTTTTTTLTTTPPTTIPPTTTEPPVITTEKDDIIISFNVLGGNAVSPLTVKQGVAYTLPTTSKSGYQFNGWLLNGVSFVPSETTLTENITLTASYSLVTYNITYNNLQDTTTSNAVTYTIETPSIALSNPTNRTGYTFSGWYDAQTGGTQVLSIALGSTGNKTLYARWSPVEITIILHYNQETITLKMNYGDVPLTVLSSYIEPKLMDIFLGWYTDLGLSNLLDPSKPLTQNLEIYPKFSDYYLVTYYNIETLDIVKSYENGMYFLTSDGDLFSGYNNDLYLDDSYFDLNISHDTYPYYRLNPLFGLTANESIADVVGLMEDTVIVKTSLNRYLLYGYNLPPTLPKYIEYPNGMSVIDLEACVTLNSDEHIRSLIFSEMNLIVSTNQSRVFIIGRFGPKSNPTQYDEPFEVTDDFNLDEDEYFVEDFMTEYATKNEYFRTNKGFYVYTDSLRYFIPNYVSDDVFIKVDSLLTTEEKVIYFQFDFQFGYILMTETGKLIGQVESSEVDKQISLLPNETIINLDYYGIIYTNLGNLYQVNLYGADVNLGEDFLNENEKVVGTYYNDNYSVLIATNQNRVFSLDEGNLTDITQLLAAKDLGISNLVKCRHAYLFIKNGSIYEIMENRIHEYKIEGYVPSYAIYGVNQDVALETPSALNYLVDGWIDIDYNEYERSSDLTGNISLYPKPINPTFVSIEVIVNNQTKTREFAVGSLMTVDRILGMVPYGFELDYFEINDVNLGKEFVILCTYDKATLTINLNALPMQKVTINYVNTEGVIYYTDDVYIVTGDSLTDIHYPFNDFIPVLQKIAGFYTDNELTISYQTNKAVSSDIVIYVDVVEKDKYTITFILDESRSHTIDFYEGEFVSLLYGQVDSILQSEFVIAANERIRGYYSNADYTNEQSYLIIRSNLTLYIDTYFYIPTVLNYYNEAGQLLDTINADLKTKYSIKDQVSNYIDAYFYGYGFKESSITADFASILDENALYDGLSKTLHIKLYELDKVLVRVHLTNPDTNQVYVENIYMVAGDYFQSFFHNTYDVDIESLFYLDEAMTTEVLDFYFLDTTDLYVVGIINKPVELTINFTSGIDPLGLTHYSGYPFDIDNIIYYIQMQIEEDVNQVNLFTDSAMTIPFTDLYINQDLVLYANYVLFTPYTLTLVSIDDVFEDFLIKVEDKTYWDEVSIFYSYLNRLIIQDDFENVSIYLDAEMTQRLDENLFITDTTLYVKSNITDARVITAVYTNGTDFTHTQKFTFVNSSTGDIDPVEFYWYIMEFDKTNTYTIYLDSSFTVLYSYNSFTEDTTVYFKMIPRSIITINYVFVGSTIPNYQYVYYDTVFFSDYTLRDFLEDNGWIVPYYTIDFYSDLGLTDNINYESYNAGTHTVYVVLEEVETYDFEAIFIGVDIPNHVFTVYPFESIWNLVFDYLDGVSEGSYGMFSMQMYVDSDYDIPYTSHNFTEDYELYVFVLLPTEETFYVDFIFPELNDEVVSTPFDITFILKEGYKVISYYGNLNYEDFTSYDSPTFFSDPAFAVPMDPFTILDGTVSEVYVKLSNDTDAIITLAFGGDNEDVFYVLMTKSYLILDTPINYYFTYNYNKEINYYYAYTDPQRVTQFVGPGVVGNTILYVDVTFIVE